ncbi:MAG: response regulator transcription factor [Candidatus Binatia bacterium]
MNFTTPTVPSRIAGAADTGSGSLHSDWTSPSSPPGSIPTSGMVTELRALSEREKQILRLICDGLSNAEIATRLGLSSETVKADLKRIFRKIDVKNRTQAAVRVVRQGLA